ncbi:MAG: deoxyuridine 5'-triphosphate nucleotidohydrolase [Lachnospiraceae bacterium]|nr:deoxyuridine 5'-triphosphate nucleotidohydrolase [Lachnospiraceae bacterium]
MARVARFTKVTRDRYIEDWKGIEENYNAALIYDSIRQPKRATVGSAGYDFFCPFGFELNPGDSITIPTGIRAEIQQGWVLMLYPRATLGFKYKLRLDNTTGVIDSDYFLSYNEGHIFIKVTNCGEKVIRMMAGDAFVQGVFLPFGITIEDDTIVMRNGGIGSTDDF